MGERRGLPNRFTVSVGPKTECRDPDGSAPLTLGTSGPIGRMDIALHYPPEKMAAQLPRGWMCFKRLNGYNLVRNRDGMALVGSADPSLWPAQIAAFEFNDGAQWTPEQIAAMQNDRPTMTFNLFDGVGPATRPIQMSEIGDPTSFEPSITMVTDDLLGQRNAAWQRIRELEAQLSEVPFIRGGHYDPADSERYGSHLIWWPDELHVPFFAGEKGSRTLHVNCPTSGMPTYYDIGHDERKPITQAVLDSMANGIQAARDALFGENVLLTEMAQRNGEIDLLRQALAAKDARIAELKSVLACTPVAFEDPDVKPAPAPGFLQAIRRGNKAVVGMVTGRGDMPRMEP